jgi:hypothetical protein
MKGLSSIVVLLALASLFLIHLHDAPAFWAQLATPRAGQESGREPVETRESTEEDWSTENLSEKGPEEDAEPVYKTTLDEADRWIGKASLEYWRCAADWKERDKHARRLLEHTDEALNILDWLDHTYPDHQDIQERMEETYKMRQAALKFGADD